MFTQIDKEMEAAEVEDVPTDMAPQTTGTSSEPKGTKRKQSDRKRGDRGRNRFPDETYNITELSPSGEPLAPLQALPRFRAAVGHVVRQYFDISWRDWSEVPALERKKAWKKICTRFVWPEGQKKLAKGYVMKQLPISFRQYRHEMKKKWLETGRDPTKRYNITAAQWARFRELKEEEDFKAKSVANSKLAKKNVYPHHLGIGGYKGKIPKWREEDEAKRKAGEPVLSDTVGDRPSNWLRGRKADAKGDDLHAPEELKEVTAKMLQAAEMTKKGEFKPKRECDILSYGLGK